MHHNRSQLIQFYSHWEKWEIPLENLAANKQSQNYKTNRKTINWVLKVYVG